MCWSTEICKFCGKRREVSCEVIGRERHYCPECLDSIDDNISLDIADLFLIYGLISFL